MQLVNFAMPCSPKEACSVLSFALYLLAVLLMTMACTCLTAWHLIQLCRSTCCRLKHTLLCCSTSFDELVLQVRQFIDELAPGSLVADVGCGNGKYFLVRQDIAVLGSDRSSGLAGVAATRLAAGTGAASGTPCCIIPCTPVFGTVCLEPRTARQAKCSVRREGKFSHACGAV